MKSESAEYKGQVAWEVAYTDTYLNQTFLTWGFVNLDGKNITTLFSLTYNGNSDFRSITNVGNKVIYGLQSPKIILILKNAKLLLICFTFFVRFKYSFLFLMCNLFYCICNFVLCIVLGVVC
jgi:hypothetical protein